MERGGLSSSLGETLALFEGSRVPRTTPEVAERLDIGRRAAYARLERLVEKGRLETKKVGANARVWWWPRTAADDDGGDGAEAARSAGASVQRERQFRSLVEASEEYAVFTLDSDGYVETWNSGAERIEGYDADDIVGEHVSTFYTEDDRAAGVPGGNLTAAAETGSAEVEGWRVREDGTRFWANVTITAVREDGELEGFVNVVRDMTDRREYEQRLREERDFSRKVLETTPASIFVLGSAGEVEMGNDRFREQLRVDEEPGALSIGELDVFDESGALVPPEERPYDTALRTGETVRDWQGRIELPTGDRRWISFNATPITDADDDVEQVVVTAQDVTKLREQQRQLERQRDDLRAELNEVFARIDDAFFALDDEWRITHLNDRTAELVRLPARELLGARVWDVLPEVAEGRPREMAERAMETQESVEFEFYSEMLDIWVGVRGYPSETGLSVYFRDVTDRKERERQLEEYERIVETVEDGIFLLDEDRRIRLVNEAFTSITGRSHEELLGARASAVIDDEIAEFARDGPDRSRADRAGDTTEFELETADGDAITVEARYVPLAGGSGAFRGTVGVIRDVTDRKEHERALEEYRRWTRTLVENFPSGVAALVDDDLRYVTFAGTPQGEVDVTRDDLEGAPVGDALPREIADVVVPRYEAALEGDASEFEHRIDGRTYQFHFVPVRDDDGDIFAVAAMSQDITEQKERERELREAKSRLEAATEAGAVATWEWRVPEDRLVAGPSFAETFGVDPEAVREGVSIDRVLEAVHEEDRQRVEREIEAALEACGEYDTEYRVRNADGEYRWVVARGHVECDDDGNTLTFPGALTDITERKAAEEELERRGQQLAALNNLNEVAREITGSVIEQSTREEIERTVCQRLAASDSYQFAWIGDADAASETVNLRTEAGVEGYLDDVTVSIDPDDERSRGPTGQALRTGEPQVTHDVRADPRHDPWRDHVSKYDFRSSAAVPIVHEGTVYGVLNVYADRPRAFDGQERDVIGQLGEVVGHAIAATERKRALMSDELTELEFRIQDVFAALDAPVETDGTIALEHAVSIGDGEFLYYGTATPDAVDTVTGLVEARPHWREVTFHSRGDPAEFELRMTDPPVLSVVASLGGYIERTVIEDGDYQMTIHLAPSVDVRRALDAIEAAYPQAEMLRRRQISREPDESRRFQRHLVSNLTDRQRTALETAYHAGFFEWPRDTSGEELAESIGVASPTFHQHLRKAERKVFESVFTSPAPRAE